ncbi:MAG: HDOD domain-containing protein [Hahellaceae bacterium]|jgi:HD-like signal output (HDOD) protein|nr:HDOD domain-containing protein [Hahellaceae bacterium]MCP5211080.1 HDOD domain-containing protein [Hahellaceae bacterium]
MWSWWIEFFTARHPAPEKSASKRTPPTASLDKAPLSNSTGQDNLSAREWISTEFYHYLLGASGKELESATGTQIYTRLSKTFVKPEVDTSQLPRMPAALPMLIKMLNDDDADARSITGAILSDPNLTGKILQVANSPLFHIRPDPIESIDQAIFILGKDGIRNLVSTSLFSPMMMSKNKAQEAFTKKAWKWALINASTAETLARHSNLNPSEYYLWGLFPPLAHLLIFQQTYAAYQKISEKYQPEAIVVEKLLNGFVWHFCVQLAKNWKLPKQSAITFAEMMHKDNYQRPHLPLADAMTLSQALILNHEFRDRVPSHILQEALQSHDQAIGKATKTAIDKLTAC